MQDRVIALTRGEFQSSGDVRRFKKRIVRENLVVRRARRQQVEHVLDADAQASNAGTPPALLRIDRDAMKFTHNCAPCCASWLSAAISPSIAECPQFATG